MFVILPDADKLAEHIDRMQECLHMQEPNPDTLRTALAFTSLLRYLQSVSCKAKAITTDAKVSNRFPSPN